MPIPDLMTIVHALLHHLSDGEEHRLKNTVDAIADYFELTQAELEQMTAGGNAPRFKNRVGWAHLYLKDRDLIQHPRHAHYQITALGQEVLKDNPQRIDDQYLMDLRDRRQDAVVTRDIHEEPIVQPDEEQRRIIMADTIYTTRLFWDCNCNGADSHHSYHEIECLDCDAHRNDCPDARLNELSDQHIMYINTIAEQVFDLKTTLYDMIKADEKASREELIREWGGGL